MLKLHIGCGEKDFGDDWVHIDARPLVKGVMVLQDEQMFHLPFEAGSVEMIYCCHTLTYWDWEEGVRLLSHWRDLLCDGGILRLSVVNFVVLCRIYQASGRMWDVIGPLMGRIIINGQLRYNKSVYDQDSLCDSLRRAGFQQESIRLWSLDDWPKQDRARRRDCSVVSIDGELVSLNLEAVR